GIDCGPQDLGNLRRPLTHDSEARDLAVVDDHPGPTATEVRSDLLRNIWREVVGEPAHHLQAAIKVVNRRDADGAHAVMMTDWSLGPLLPRRRGPTAGLLRFDQSVYGQWAVTFSAAPGRRQPASSRYGSTAVSTASTAACRVASSAASYASPSGPTSNSTRTSSSAVAAVIRREPATVLILMSANPTWVRMAVTRWGSASENGPGSSGPGMVRSAFRTGAAVRVGTNIHGLSANCAHTAQASRPRERSERPMLANAATGSEKNMTPNLE